MNKSFLEHQQRFPDVPQTLADKFSAIIHKLLAGSSIAPTLFYKCLTAPLVLEQKTHPLQLEIVSHCWNYSHFLAFQLSSLVQNPPSKLSVTMTVFYSSDDKNTQSLLDFFARQTIKNVTWNWQELPPNYLFRRAIGRNIAAKNSTADWVWFTDCDETFQADCLDALANILAGNSERLLYPETEYKTAALSDEELGIGREAPGPDEPGNDEQHIEHRLRDVSLSDFAANHITRATGPLQITHGDAARAYGYCDMVACYQKPASHWCKAHEDRVFRWLLQTQGKPIKLPGVYRIQHQSKGRQKSNSTISGLRNRLRTLRYRKNDPRNSISTNEDKTLKGGK